MRQQVEIRVVADSSLGVAAALHVLAEKILAHNAVHDDIGEIDYEKLPEEYIGFNVEVLDKEHQEDIFGNPVT